MKFDLNSKIGRFKLFMAILLPTLIVGFLITYFAVQSIDEPRAASKEVKESEQVEVGESEKTDSSPVSEEKEESEVMVTAPYSDMVSKEEKEASKFIAEQFAQAYGNYDSEKPFDFIHNANPFMTEEFSSHWEENPPRRPLALVKSTVTSFDTYPVDTDYLNALAWNVVLKEDTINTLGDRVFQETALLILVEKEKGEWKVKGVNVTNG